MCGSRYQKRLNVHFYIRDLYYFRSTAMEKMSSYTIAGESQG